MKRDAFQRILAVIPNANRPLKAQWPELEGRIESAVAVFEVRRDLGHSRLPMVGRFEDIAKHADALLGLLTVPEGPKYAQEEAISRLALCFPLFAEAKLLQGPSRERGGRPTTGSTPAAPSFGSFLAGLALLKTQAERERVHLNSAQVSVGHPTDKPSPLAWLIGVELRDIAINLLSIEDSFGRDDLDEPVGYIIDFVCRVLESFNITAKRGTVGQYLSQGRSLPYETYGLDLNQTIETDRKF